ncbi:MAG: inverse autotransporter beta domain-containing protein [Planctomycetes bacterium]|nr:inverse autotransporter beta domain-containing protein [Planctomycetota bacterium]
MKSTLGLGLSLALALSAQTGLGQDSPDFLLPRPEIFRDDSEVFRAQYGEPERQPDYLRSVPDPAQTEFGDAVQDGLMFGDTFSGRTGQAYGALVRAGVMTGPAVGRTNTIVPMEIMPYGFINNAMIFGSIRGFRASSDGWGMNLGGGIRYYSERWDRIWGANAYYDYDNSSTALFREVGFGFESLGSLWDMRANAYIPHGTTQHLLRTELVDGSQRFVDHRLLYDNKLTYGNALRGVDWEMGIPVPGRVPLRHDLRVFGGWYYYNGSSTDGFAGWKIRAQANVVQNVNVQLEVLNDKVFNTSVVFGATWTYGGFSQPENQRKTTFDRMTEMVRRNYNIIVAEIPFIDAGKVAINPLTNNPYFFEHVASYAPVAGADGTVEHPWQTLTQATTALNTVIPNPADQAGNIIYVHANSVYSSAPDNQATLIPTVRILGEGKGIQHRVRIAQLGNILLPRATNFNNRPIFSNQTGNAVTLVSGTTLAPSEFSGFQIGDPTVASSGPTGVGVFGDGVANVRVNQDDINFAGGDGVFLNNLTGTVTMLGTTINNVGNVNTSINSLHVVGGTGTLLFGAEPFTLKRSAINNTAGHAVFIDGLLRGGVVDMTGSDINDGTFATATVAAKTGGGILLNNIDGQVTIDSATLLNTAISADTTGRAIDIEGTAATALTPAMGLGQINFVGGIGIDNPASDAIHIQNLQADSTVTPNLISNVRFFLPNPVNGTLAPGIRITNRNAGGVTMLNNAGNVSFLEPVSISANGAPVQAAIDYEGSSGNASFLALQASSSPNQIQITGGGGNGIQIGLTSPNTGAFRTSGVTNIQQIALDSILVGNPLFGAATPASNQGQVTFGDVSIDNRGQRGIQIVHVDHSVVFSGNTTVANTTGSLFSAVDIHDNLIALLSPRIAGDATFRSLNILAAQGPVTLPISSGAGLNVVNNPTSVSIQLLNINQNSLVGNGTALYANNVGTQPPVITTTSVAPAIGLSIGSGNIFSQGGPAVSISNSVIGVSLTSVSSRNSVEDGIFLSNNVGVGSKVNTNATTVHPTIFSVNGVGNALGSGGLIQGSTLDGIFVLNSESVQFRDMNVTGNHQNGIFATTPSLTVLNNQVTGNDKFGVNVYAVAVPLTQATRTLQTVAPIFTMQGSTITGNGLTSPSGTQQVLFTASTLGSYTVNLGAGGTAGNTIVHTFTPAFAAGVNENRGPAAAGTAPTTDDGVLIRTESGGIGSILNLTAVNNQISVAVANGVTPGTPLSDMRVDWNGQVARGTIEGNTFNYGITNAEGLVLNLQSPTDSSVFRIAGNNFNSPTNDGTTGLDVTTNGGPANIQIGSLDGYFGNVFTTNQPNNILGAVANYGMRFNLGANSFVSIFNNTINMTGSDNQAIQFTTVAGPSTVDINGNTIALTNQGNFFANEFGINILSVTAGTLNLFGTVDNSISINNQFLSIAPWFSSPTTGINGTISVNGNPVP